MDGITPFDRYCWRAHLIGGSVIAETDVDGWASVPADRVRSLELMPLVDGARAVWLDVPPGATAGLGRRRHIGLNLETGQQWDAGTLTFVRWQLADVQTWLYVTDDGTVSVLYQELD